MKKDADISKDVVVNEIAFHKDSKTGYLISTSHVDGRRVRLHIYLWEKLNGCRVPDGFEVHHINGNKDDNRIENLQLLSSLGHRRVHAENMTEEQREWCRKNLEINARPKASLWHKSEEGRAWHKKMAVLASRDRYKRHKVKCEVCGVEFMGIYKSKYCSAKCKQRANVMSGLYNEERICPICGRKFIVNKYDRRKTCSVACGAIHRVRTMKCKKQGE